LQHLLQSSSIRIVRDAGATRSAANEVHDGNKYDENGDCECRRPAWMANMMLVVGDSSEVNDADADGASATF
jgi:hypothetical protein